MKKWFSKLLPLYYGQLLNLMVIFRPTMAARKAFNIFSTVRKGRVGPQQAPFLEPAKHQLELIKGHQVQSYRWPGSKETVLLIHGWESNSHRWRNLITKLRAHDYNVLTFDAPGHGNSSGSHLHVPLYAKTSRYFLEKYQPNFVIGHSMGGMTILYDHFAHGSSSAQKIVTIGSPCDLSEVMFHFQHILRFNDRVLGALHRHLYDLFGIPVAEFSSTRFVSKNTVPGLLFHDEEDAQVPISASQKVHQHWQGSQLITTKGLGHSMHQENVNDTIIAFLKEPTRS